MTPTRRASVALVVVATSIAAACSGGDDSTDGSETVESGTVSEMTTPPESSESTEPVESTGAPSSVPETTSPETTSPETTSPETTAPPTTETVPVTTAPPVIPFADIGPVVDHYVTANGMNGAGLLIVDRDDGIVYSDYWGEFDAERSSFVASASKMISSGVLMRLAEDGLLDLDAPVADAVDWGSGNPEITPAQLLSNSSGLRGIEPDPTFGPYLCQFLPDREIEECARTVFLTPDDDADVVAPDTEYRYGGVQWQVAGGLAEAVSGQSWAELIDEIYVQPCGIDSLGYNNHFILTGGTDYPVGVDPTSLEPTENPNVEGGAYIAPPDYAELLLMHLRGGECPNGRVMSPQSVDRLHADRTIEVYPESTDAPGYGLGWWVDRDSGGVSNNGAYGVQTWLDLDEGFGVYLVVEATGQLGFELATLISPLVDDGMVAYRSS